MRAPQCIRLDDHVRASLHAALLGLESPYEQLHDCLLSLYILFGQVPRDVLGAVLSFATDPAAPGCLIIDNMPIDPDLPPTPGNSRRSELKRTFVSEGCLLGIAQLVGSPLGYHNEKDGELIQNVSPVASETKKTSSESSEIALGFHTDFDFDESDPELPYNVTNADLIVLFCLRRDPDGTAFTLYADARDICEVLSRQDISMLRTPSFEFGASYSFTGLCGDSRVWSHPTAILRGPHTSPEISVDMLCGVRGITSEATAALRNLTVACTDERVAQRVCLAPGQMLLIDNRKGAHARTVFNAYFEGGDRWLQRVYARRSLWELRGRATSQARIF
jgi:L-asparagine oxygenase